MAAFTALALAASVGSMAYGAYNSYEGSQEQQAGYEKQQQGYAIQQQAAAQQAAIYKQQAASSVTYAGQERDLNVQAANQSSFAATASQSLNKSVMTEELEVQKQQQQAMELDARRQQLEVIRNQQRGRSLALTTAVAQGGSGGTRSSGLAGGYGQISGQSGVNLLGIQQNLDIGRNIFGQNNQISANKMQLNDLQTMYSLQQADNQTAKANMAYGYAQVQAGYQTQLADTQTLMSQGQGVVNQGSGMVGMGQSQSAMGSSFMQAGASIFSMGTGINQLSGNLSNSLGSAFWQGTPSGTSMGYKNMFAGT